MAGSEESVVLFGPNHQRFVTVAKLMGPAGVNVFLFANQVTKLRNFTHCKETVSFTEKLVAFRNEFTGKY